MRGKRVKELKKLTRQVIEAGYTVSFRRVKMFYNRDKAHMYKTMNEMIQNPKPKPTKPTVPFVPKLKSTYNKDNNAF